jgi:putative membrane-bound dehydrogenase-like protein
MKRSLFLLAILFGACQSPKVGTPPKPSAELQKALDDFEIADGFEIELVAAEPLVSDPVAIEIDEDGRMYVAEMHGYPLDLAGSGKIKLLQDTNADGYPDKSTVFAENLVLPTGLMRWRKGLLVTDAPHVWYLEDTNNDGRADVKKAVLTGFALSNPQHNLNTPVFGLDNWIYLAHQWAITPMVCKKEFGDEGSEVHFPDNLKAPRLGKNGDDRNIRFKPDTYELEALSGESQFGQTFDNFGHHFLTENANHAYQEVMAARYLKRNPHLLVPETTQSIPDHGDACEVFPTTEKPDHQLLTDVGVMTSACGITFYNGGSFPKNLNEHTLFVAEPVHNLVHIDHLTDDGVSFKASRVLEKKDFLTSKDGWFRPVNFYVGPDGAMYVVDYYRQIVEHPEWMSDEVNKSGALYNGTQKGRIYRIVPRGGLPMDWLGKLKLSETSDKELINLLENNNAWYRRTAQRLLFERKTKETKALETMATGSSSAEARTHALWLLDGLGAITEATLLANISHEQTGVRENVLKIAEKYLEKYSNLTKAVLAMTNDASQRVRFQALCSIGDLQGTQANKAKMTFLAQNIQDSWVQSAGISAFAGQENMLFDWAVSSYATQPNEANSRFFMFLAATIANSKNKENIAALLAKCSTASKESYWQAATLNGLAKLWENIGVGIELSEKQKEQITGNFQENTPKELRDASLNLLKVIGLPTNKDIMNRAATVAQNLNTDVDFRADAIRLLGMQNPVKYQTQLEEWLVNNQSVTVKLAALQTIDACKNDRTAKFLIQQFDKFTPNIQSQVIGVLMDSPNRTMALLNALAKKQISTEQVGWQRMVRLMTNGDLTVRNYARKILASSGLTRESVLNTYTAALRMQGNYARGEKVFERVCQTCHQLNGKGIAFGPDLSSLRNRPVDNILKEIIVPNNSIADKYEYWVAQLKNGSKIEGILANKTATTLTFRQLGGSETTISRSEVLKLDASQESAMPNGLEGAITVSEMSDLLAYIKNLR